MGACVRRMRLAAGAGGVSTGACCRLTSLCGVLGTTAGSDEGVLPMTTKQFFAVFLADAARLSFMDLHMSAGHTELTVTPWLPAEQGVSPAVPFGCATSCSCRRMCCGLTHPPPPQVSG